MKILINRTDAIGDTLLSIPLGRLIKFHYPEAQIGMIVSPRSAELIPLCVGIDKVYTLEVKASFKEKYSSCRKFFSEFKPDHYFHMGGDFTPSAFAFFKGIPFRGGLVSKIPSFIYLNQGVRQSRSLVEQHESEYNMDLARPMGITWDKEFVRQNCDSLSPKFILDEIKREKIRKSRFDFEGRKLIFIHPGMSGHTLNWPNEYYGELANQIYENFKDEYKIIVSFTPSDHKYVAGMKASMNEDVIADTLFFDGSIAGLVDFTYVLSLAALFIGPSTGTTHMANALRLKQVALYSPIKVQSLERWGPFFRDENVEVFRPNIGSVNISTDYKKEDLEQSMTSITVEEVLNVCKKLLGLKG